MERGRARGAGHCIGMCRMKRAFGALLGDAAGDALMLQNSKLRMASMR
jgi:hypothetical protein